MGASQSRAAYGADPQDPREAGPKPPFPAQQQPPTGEEAQMRPQPDYGEATYVGSGKLMGKAALITGGDSGIGRAVALAYAREGADVAIAYLEADDDAEETGRLVRAEAGQFLAIKGDVGDEGFCRRLVDRTVAELGGLDILVNNAAYQATHERLEDFPSDEIERVVRTNLLALFWTCKAAAPHLRAGGAIVNTASIEAYQPKPPLLHYAATKGAVVTFTKGLALEMIGRGVRVNAVAPGPVWTPLIPSSMLADEVRTFGQDNPVGRPAQPAELAPAYVFLASGEASFVNGEILGVTGGEPLP
jgi:NAD(P)-dependent dehydrogenase (short-subunit alcohol dehydrogenase family)